MSAAPPTSMDAMLQAALLEQRLAAEQVPDLSRLVPTWRTGTVGEGGDPGADCTVECDESAGQPGGGTQPAVNATGRDIVSGDRVLVLFDRPQGVWIQNVLVPVAGTAATGRLGASYTASQSVSNNSVTTITMDTEVEDTLGIGAAASSSLVIPGTAYPGVYLVTVSMSGDSGGTALRRFMELTRGGSIWRRNAATFEDELAIAVHAPFTADATLTVRYFHQKGSSMSTTWEVDIDLVYRFDQ